MGGVSRAVRRGALLTSPRPPTQAALATATAAPRKSTRKAAPPASEVSPDFKYPPVRAWRRSLRVPPQPAHCHGTQVTGDGMGILQHDSYLAQHRGHLQYRRVLPTPLPPRARGPLARAPR